MTTRRVFEAEQSLHQKIEPEADRQQGHEDAIDRADNKDDRPKLTTATEIINAGSSNQPNHQLTEINQSIITPEASAPDESETEDATPAWASHLAAKIGLFVADNIRLDTIGRLEKTLLSVEEHFSWNNIIKRYRAHLADLSRAKIEALVVKELQKSSSPATEVCQYFDELDPSNRPTADDLAAIATDPVRLSKDISAIIDTYERQSGLLEFAPTGENGLGDHNFRPPSDTADQPIRQILVDAYQDYLLAANRLRQINGSRPIVIDATVNIYSQSFRANIDGGEFQDAIEGQIETLVGARIGPEQAAEIAAKTDGLLRPMSPAMASLTWDGWRRRPRYIADIERGVTADMIARIELSNREKANLIIEKWSDADRQELSKILSERDTIHQQELAKLIFECYRQPFDLLISKLRAFTSEAGPGAG